MRPKTLDNWGCVSMAVLIVLLIVGIAAAENPFAKQSEPSPPEILASVRVGSSGGCSGTTFASDGEYAYVLSAGHCVRSNEAVVGQKVGICTVDGIVHPGEWIAIDKDKDLAIARYRKAAALALTPIPEATPLMDGSWVAVGFPATNGPNKKTVGNPTVITNTNVAAKRWSLDVKSGTFAGGDSGGGVFAGKNLVGVMTHGNTGGPIHAASHNQLREFVATVPSVANAMGLPDCPNGICEVCPKCGKVHGRGEHWTPKPNVPIVLPKEERQAGDKEAFKDVVATAKILDLERKLAALEARLAALEKKAGGDVAPLPPPEGIPGPVGPAGKPGVDGKDGVAGVNGKDGKPGVVTVILTDTNGREISRANEVQTGSVVRLTEKKTLAQGK